MSNTAPTNITTSGMIADQLMGGVTMVLMAFGSVPGTVVVVIGTAGMPGNELTGEPPAAPAPAPAPAPACARMEAIIAQVPALVPWLARCARHHRCCRHLHRSCRPRPWPQAA